MAQPIGYYVDFLAVGEGERSGDAISIKYVNDDGTQKVLVVDGGDKATGQKMVERINYFYGTNRVDYLVNTHPDADHASGLEVVLEKMDVGEVWVHQPWNYPQHIYQWCTDGRITPNSLRARLCDALGHAHRVWELAQEKGIPTYEPFQGARIGECFWVASPSREWYLDIIAHFDKTPETNAPRPQGLRGLAEQLVERAKTWVDENWNVETLKANPTTSFDNESSVVLYGYLADRGILLTADAGVQALTRAASYLEQHINVPKSLNVVQIPHHGSRHNVDPAILDRLLGPKLQNEGSTGLEACVTAGAKSTTHPRKVVTNAFRRRGVSVYTAKGEHFYFRYNLPERPGFTTQQPLQMFNSVEG